MVISRTPRTVFNVRGVLIAPASHQTFHMQTVSRQAIKSSAGEKDASALDHYGIERVKYKV